MRNTASLFSFIFALAAVACAPIQHVSDITQPINRVLAAGPGDVLVRVDKKRNLVNAFGGADVFGRKTNEGFSELYFGGFEADGTTVFYRRGANILTDETTMSRSGVGQSYSTLNGTATTYGNSASVNGTLTTTTIMPVSAYHIAVPADAMSIRLPKGQNRLLFDGYLIQLLDVTPTSVSYRIEIPSAS